MEEFEYTENIVGTYADEVTRQLDNMIEYSNGLYTGPKYLVDVEMLRTSTGKVACGQC